MGRRRQQEQGTIAPNGTETDGQSAARAEIEARLTPAPTPTPAAPKQTPAERAAARLAARDALRAKGEVARNAAGRPDARGLPCLCGCGDPTHRDDAWFRSGHDARLRKAVIFGSLGLSGVPEIVRPFFRLGAPIAGLLLHEDGETLLDVKRGGGGISAEHELA